MTASTTARVAAAFFVTSFLPVLSGQEKAKADRIEPTFADISYGAHPRNVLDLWLPRDGNAPARLVLFIHGGGFQRGDKSNIGAANLKRYLEEGWAVASINYRLTDSAPAPAAYLDCARALQFLRHNAQRWHLDSSRVALTGSSAGAGTSLWLAFHDDLADPRSPDPVARESTRVTCVAVRNAQPSYDPRFAAKAGIPRPNFERHDFFLPFFGITKDEIDTPSAYRRYEAAAAVTYLTRDDPPVMIDYLYRNEVVTTDTDIMKVVHHPLLGLELRREMTAIGLECTVQYQDAQTGETVQEPREKGAAQETPVNFIRKHFR